MDTLVSNIGMSGTLITLDIAKKHHDAKIRHPDGRTSYLRIENTLEGFNRLLALTTSPHEDIIAAFEPTSRVQLTMLHRLISAQIRDFSWTKTVPR